jgi:hypothetical protein
MLTGGTFNGMPRIDLFPRSCTVAGSEAQFFVANEVVVNPPESVVERTKTTKPVLPTWVPYVIAFGAASLIAISSALWYLVKKEQSGDPVFVKLADNEVTATSSKQSNAMHIANGEL